MKCFIDEGAQDDYSEFSRDQLIEEITILKNKLKQALREHETRLSKSPKNEEEELINSSSSRINKITVKNDQDKKKIKELNFADYSRRKIALMISYQGTKHGGLAWQPEVTPLSTVEAELFKALLTSRLVERKKTNNNLQVVDFNEPEHLIQAVDLGKWGYSRAGRTDAGVSGSGQVVSLWVRSRLKSAPSHLGFQKSTDLDNKAEDESRSEDREELNDEGKEHEPINYELAYHTILNSILPSSVRVLAWSPVSEKFDARFSCQARHYKYFFSLYENSNGPPLNIQAMREGAKRLIGEHDFRNFCKIDPSKQINNFHRKILSAEIKPVHQFDQEHSNSTSVNKENMLLSHSNSSNQLFVLDLIGTAFLYNMVRHIVSILFLIGAGLESVDLIDRMFYTERIQDESENLTKPVLKETVESKPEYVHANALPLLFYRSIYAEGTFEWITTPHNSIKPSSTDVFSTWSKDRIAATLSYYHLQAHDQLVHNSSSFVPSSWHKFHYQPLGAAELRSSARYVPILHRPRAPHFSIINSNWWHKIGTQKLAKRQLLSRS